MAPGHPMHPASTGWPTDGLAVWALIGGAAIMYARGVRLARSTAGHRRWPRTRLVAWYAGLATVGAGLTGPIATSADTDFTAHMLGHLLAGMLGPLLLVCGAPLNLALRALPTRRARTLSHILRSRPVHWLTHPLVAGAIDVGGLVALYLTGLYGYAMDHPIAHAAVHTHVVLAGYVFSYSVVGIDPGTRRSSYTMRASALLAVAAAHGMLAKYLYANPLAGVPIDVGQRAAMLMYYGGDAIDIALIALLCHQWYAATRPARRDSDRKGVTILG
jgi:putative membrane protein